MRNFFKVNEFEFCFKVVLVLFLEWICLFVWFFVIDILFELFYWYFMVLEYGCSWNIILLFILMLEFFFVIILILLKGLLLLVW